MILTNFIVWINKAAAAAVKIFLYFKFMFSSELLYVLQNLDQRSRDTLLLNGQKNVKHLSKKKYWYDMGKDVVSLPLFTTSWTTDT